MTGDEHSTRTTRWKQFADEIDSAPFRYRFGGVVVLAAWFALIMLGPDIPILRNGEIQRMFGGTVVGRTMVWLFMGLFWWPAGLVFGHFYWTLLGNGVSESEQ